MSQEDRTIREMANAEIVPEMSGPEQLYVRFGKKDYGFVSRTERNRILVETDLLDEAQDGIAFTADADDAVDGYVVIEFTADFEADDFELMVDFGDDVDTLTVPSEFTDDVLRAVREEDADGLYEAYEEIRATQVRQDVVNQFYGRYVGEEMRTQMLMDAMDEADVDMEPRVEMTNDGWVIDDTFIVKWNAENYLVSDMNVHVRDGDRTVEADESKQAREMEFSAIDGPRDAETPDGETVTLGEREQKFLASVEALVHPHKYLDAEAAQDIREMVDLNDDTITGLAASARCTAFTDETDGLYHGHGLQKHRLQDLGVTDETVERLHHRGDGHSGVHELAMREQEFRNADFDVFEDAHNTDPYKWRMINNTREKAPIPDHVRRNLNQMFGE